MEKPQNSAMEDPKDARAASTGSTSPGILENRSSSYADSQTVKPKVHFNFYQTLGMVFSVALPPIAVGLYLSLVIGVGGFPYFIWAFLFTAVFQIITMFAIAEIASALPHSSGPAYWVQYLAPDSYSQFLGYIVGWLTNALWWFVCVVDCLYLAQCTLGMAMAMNPGYDPPPWQYYLVYCAWAVLAFVHNLPGLPFRSLPLCIGAATFIINASALYLVITLLVRSTPKPTAHQVFVEVVNETGWTSKGVVFFIATLPGYATVNLYDSITHITDEVDTPTKQVPQVMIAFTFLSAITGFLMTIVYSFSATHPENLLTPYGDQPLVQLIFDASRSTALALIGSILVLVCLYLATISSLTSWNRLYWSFAREGALPFSTAMARLSSNDNIPVNALIANIILIILLGLIQLGSKVAINNVASGAVVTIAFTYSLVLGLALWRGRDFLPRERWLDLGIFAVPLQVISLVWSVFISIWLCFPLYQPVTLVYMNWGSLVFAGVMIVSMGYWVMLRRNIRAVKRS